MLSEWHKTQKLLHQILPDNAWRNERCYILGGGPSLKNFDLSKTIGSRVIAINRAYQICPWADILASCDDYFYSLHKNEPLFRNHSGLKVMMLVDPNPNLEPDVWVVPGIIERSTGTIQDGLGHGWNSGYGALMLALALGCDPVYLIGFDMQGNADTNTQAWWHDGYGGYPLQSDASCYNRYAGEFEWAVDSGQISARVYSMCPTGGLRHIFPRPEPVFVNFYTPGRGYEAHAERLLASLDLIGAVLDQETIEYPGSWIKAQGLKPAFLKRKLEEHFPHPVVWVDADAVVRQKPALFFQWADEQSGPDIAVHYKDGEECLSGTVWLNQTNSTRRLLAQWVELQQATPDEWDQRLLEQLLNSDTTLKLERLPATYCQIFDSMKAAGVPVIEHFQHSRLLKEEA